jgi:bifunctional DNA-binding transcriptional regulator/antitoxin component of YhaV-PrlF toxin-antitoxin module
MTAAKALFASGCCRFSAFLYIESMQMTLSVSGRGLIALPAAMRQAAGIRPQDSLIAETTSEGILLRPAVTLPVEIYSQERIAEFDAAESELSQALELGQCFKK